MSCEYPRTAWQAPLGGPIYFNKPNGPGFNDTYWTELEIPCGQCTLCKGENARQAAVRIYHESKLHEENCFATFTYSDEHLPKAGLHYNPDMVTFWKRLRKRLGVPLKHYTVAEYGSQDGRPHYHACIFGHAFTQHRRIMRRTPHLLWTTDELEELWGHGYVRIGALNYATAKYTANYVLKKLRGKQTYVTVDETTGEITKLPSPRAYCSRHLALGWLEKYGDQVYTFDQVVIDGNPQKPPKHYDRWLKKRSPIALQMVKDERKKNSEPLTKAQTHARAENARARAREKKRAL